MAIKSDLVQVKIFSPYEVIFEGQAKAVVSKNSQGDFGIITQHANFITLVQNEKIYIHLQNGEKREFLFPMAIVFNANNLVKIYTDILAQPSKKII